MADPLLRRLCHAVLEDDGDQVAPAALIAELVRRDRAQLVPRDWGEVQIIPRLSPESLVVLSLDREVTRDQAAHVQQRAADMFGCRAVLLPKGLRLEALVAEHTVPAEAIGDPDWWRERQAWRSANAELDLDAPLPPFDREVNYPFRVVGEAPLAGSWNLPVRSMEHGRVLVETQLTGAIEQAERRRLLTALHNLHVAHAVALAMQDVEIVERVREVWRGLR